MIDFFGFNYLSMRCLKGAEFNSMRLKDVLLKQTCLKYAEYFSLITDGES